MEEQHAAAAAAAAGALVEKYVQKSDNVNSSFRCNFKKKSFDKLNPPLIFYLIHLRSSPTHKHDAFSLLKVAHRSLHSHRRSSFSSV